MTIIEFPHQSDADPAAAADAVAAPVVAHVLDVRHARLPRRFDIHQTSTVVDELRLLASDGAVVVVDGSDVEMIDLAAVTSLSLLADELDLVISAPSVALRATVGFTGHHHVATRFAFAESGRVA